jgi:hypothetical protein
MTKYGWLRMNIVRSLTVGAAGAVVEVPLSSAGEGIIGCALIFDTLENATEFSKDNDTIHKIDWEE